MASSMNKEISIKILLQKQTCINFKICRENKNGSEEEETSGHCSEMTFKGKYEMKNVTEFRRQNQPVY